MAPTWRTTVGGVAIAFLSLAAAGCSHGASKGTPPAGAVAGSTAHSGIIRVLESTQLDNRATVVITGAIADAGRSIPMNRAGNAATQGGYEQLVLEHGTIRLDDRALSEKIPRAHFDPRTCSGSVRTTGMVHVLSGTGAYTGISGRLREVVNAGFDVPRHAGGPKKGRCEGPASATHHLGLVTAVGSVSL
jgi:hypothetical protein